MSTMTRAEHLAWCRQRALEYADAGDTGNAMTSMMQDLALHPGTEASAAVIPELMFPLAMMGEFERPGELRKFIEGFQ